MRVVLVMLRPAGLGLIEEIVRLRTPMELVGSLRTIGLEKKIQRRHLIAWRNSHGGTRRRSC